MMELATRGSELALNQVEEVVDRLGVDADYRVVETEGDRFTEKEIRELGSKGVFVRELDLLVRDGEVDAAVHSMKDIPTEFLEGIGVACVLPRISGLDALVSMEDVDLQGLASGSVIGTSSLRRQAQIKRVRDDVSVEGVRGNVDTRIEKMRDGEYDALVLSMAGLQRLGISDGVHVLSGSEFVPSPNQGVVAVVSRVDSDAYDELWRIDDHETRVEVNAERVVLEEIGGGCVAPMGVKAELVGEYMDIRAEVLSLDGEEVVRVENRVPVESYLVGAERLAVEMRERGAEELIRRAAEEAG